MTTSDFTRRQWLLGAGGLGLGIALASAADAHQSDTIDTEPYPNDADEALVRLQNGNRHFMDDKPRHAHESASWRSLLVDRQKPFATILGCSDSRVPPEFIFDVGFGDLFTIRLAGNIITEDVIGSLQYALAHLHTPLVVVLGHEGCGAVTAAVEEMFHRPDEPKHIESLIKMIKPGLAKLDLTLDHDALVSAAVEANVRWSMRQLATLPEGRRLLREKHGILVGAVYELTTGKVLFLD